MDRCERVLGPRQTGLKCDQMAPHLADFTFWQNRTGGHLRRLA